jgi:hypothetical protein
LDSEGLDNGEGVLHSGAELKLVRLMGEPAVAQYDVLDTIKASDGSVGVTVNDFSAAWSSVKGSSDLQILTKLHPGVYVASFGR